MAHAIAEKMQSADAAQGDARTAVMNDCAELILKVWSHRSELPNGKRPFESFEPIFKVLEALDDQTPRYRYFGGLRDGRASKPEELPDIQAWVERAKEIDEAARGLVKFCVTKAADAAALEGRGWLELVGDVRTMDDLDLEIIIQLVGPDGKARSRDLRAHESRITKDRIRKLETLISASNDMIADLEKNVSDRQPKRHRKAKADKRNSSS